MERQVFIDAIVDDPEDTAAWVAYADWLCERGDVRGEIINLTLAADAHDDPAQVRNRIFTLTWRLDELLSPELGKVASRFRLKWWRGFIRTAEVTPRGDAPPGDKLVALLLGDPHAALIDSLDVGRYWGPVFHAVRRSLRSLRTVDLSARAAAKLGTDAPRLEALTLLTEAGADIDELAHDMLHRLCGDGGCSALTSGAFRLPRLEWLDWVVGPHSPLLTTDSSILRRPPSTLKSLTLRSLDDGWIAQLAEAPILGQLARLHIRSLRAAEVRVLCAHAAAFTHVPTLSVGLSRDGDGVPDPRGLLRELKRELQRVFPKVEVTSEHDYRLGLSRRLVVREPYVDAESRNEYGRIDPLAYFASRRSTRD